jgi:predicted dinucleotide-binding enzyme
MDIGIIGTGIVDKTPGTALVGKGHAVVMGTRDAAKLKELTESWPSRRCP